jgi:hypothetical protein
VRLLDIKQGNIKFHAENNNFFPWFLKTKQQLGFLGVVYIGNKDQREILLFTKLNIANKTFKHISEI